MQIIYSKSATKALLRSAKKLLIREKIEDLANDPLAMNANIVRLQARPEYRLRVQDWRIIFRIEDDILWIDEIGPRGSIY